jgi:ABC-type nickel/cobalt efflux system permease component RcnA
MKEAAVGAQPAKASSDPGLQHEEIARYFAANAEKLRQVKSGTAVTLVAEECAVTLTDLAATLATASILRLEDLERRLTVMEEKLLAALTMTTPENELFALRTEADREIAPYRSKMPGVQIEQLQKQFIHKRLFEKAKIPRLSLFYL